MKAFVSATEVKLARLRRELAERGQAAPVDRTANGRLSSREQRTAASREDGATGSPTSKRRSPAVRSRPGTSTRSPPPPPYSPTTRRPASTNTPHHCSIRRQLSVDDFARTCNNLARRVQHDEGKSKLNEQRRNNRVSHRVDSRTGMHHIHAELDPETGTKVMTAVRATLTSLKHRHPTPSRSGPADTDTDASADGPADPASKCDEIIARALRVVRDRTDESRTHDELMVEAFVELVTGARSVDRRVPEISVLIDYRTLQSGLHERSCSETSSGDLLPPETIRRMCCDGGIIPIVLGGHGEILDQGRKRRLATSEQRTA